jgi:hypothetical protein
MYEASIEYLPKDTFKNNFKLNFINMTDSKIVMLQHEMFSHLSVLDVLDLSNNICINKKYVEAAKFKATVESDLHVCGSGYTLMPYLKRLFSDLQHKIESRLNIIDKKFHEEFNEIDKIKLLE